MAKVMVVVRAYTEEGYHKDVIVMNEVQLRVSDQRVEGGPTGPVRIKLSDFPEVRFLEITVTDIEHS